MRRLKCFVKKVDVAADAETVCEDTDLLRIAEMSVDVLAFHIVVSERGVRKL